MRHHNITKHFAFASAIAAASFSFRASASQLLIDLQVHGGGGKTAVVSESGAVVNFDVYALVAGNNSTTTDDGAEWITTNFRTGTGGLLGDLTANTVYPFNDPDAGPATQFDVDGDGDLDLEPNPATFNGYDFATSNALISISPGPTLTNATQVIGGTTYASFLIGTVSFTVKNGSTLSPHLSTMVSGNPMPGAYVYLPQKVWFDGVYTPMYGTDSRVSVGSPVNIIVGPTIAVNSSSRADATLEVSQGKGSLSVPTDLSITGQIQLLGETAGTETDLLLTVSGTQQQVLDAYNLLLEGANGQYGVQLIGDGVSDYKFLVQYPAGTDNPVFGYDFTYSNITLKEVSAVPEPGIGALAVAGAMVAQRRRRKI